MTVRQIQCLLCYLGFDPGTPDGKLGPNTLAAIRRFQAAAHLNVDGHPGPATRQALQEAVKENVSTNSDKNRQNQDAPESFWQDIRYFRRQEFRCPCGRWCTGFPAEPKEGLVRFLDALREQLGRPVIVVPPDGHSGGSGVRCARYNATLPGSVANSTHLTGRAADFSAPGAAAGAVEDCLTRAKADGRIAYWYRIAPGSYHVNI